VAIDDRIVLSNNSYNGISPFGFNGRFVWTRLAVNFQLLPRCHPAGLPPAG
jgi:hypothetical protein